MPIAPTSSLPSVLLDVQPKQLAIDVPVEDLHRIAIVGHFRGHTEPYRIPAERRAHIVDRELLDSVVAMLEPSLTLPVGDRHVTLNFRYLRDFHPDRLWAFSPAFEDLGPRPAPPPPDDEFTEYLRRLIEPTTAPEPAPVEDKRCGSPEITGRLRGLLGHPEFQRLEGTWRGLELLTHRLAGAPGIRLELIDMSREELDSDLLADRDLQDTALYKLVAEDQPYSLILADFHFGPTIEDLAILHRLGRIGKHAGAPVIAGALADPPAWSDQCPAAWREFQETAAANWIALAYPRFLCRQPYGASGDSCELVDFEELESHPAATGLCWANSAWLCGAVLGDLFASHGVRFEPGYMLDVDRLPQYRYQREETAVAHPCGEYSLQGEAALAASAHGLIPIVPVEGSAVMRILHFQSVARARLVGRWSLE